MSDNNRNIEDILFDEDSSETLMLTGDDGKEYEFEQIATIPIEEDGKIYCILRPLTPMSAVENDNEAFVMELAEDAETGEDTLLLVEDEETADKVISIYYQLCEQAKQNGDI